MQNKPNLLDAQMNVSIFSQMTYENKSNWTLGENKPNQTQFPKSTNECKLIYNKGLQKKRRFRSPKKQTQFKANFRKAKMNLNFYLTKDYNNEQWTMNDYAKQTQSNPISEKPGWPQASLSQRITEKKMISQSKKTNPIQSQFPKGQNELKLLFNKGL